MKRLPNNVELHPLWVEGVESNNLGDINRLYFLYMNVKAVVDHGIPGAFAELEVYKGNSAKLVLTIALPEVDPFVTPILYAIPVQLLAYHTAVIKGTDVDQPRNLAKSVTVE